jgi:hypothetical protein
MQIHGGRWQFEGQRRFCLKKGRRILGLRPVVAAVEAPSAGRSSCFNSLLILMLLNTTGLSDAISLGLIVLNICRSPPEKVGLWEVLLRPTSRRSHAAGSCRLVEPGPSSSWDKENILLANSSLFSVAFVEDVFVYWESWGWIEPGISVTRIGRQWSRLRCLVGTFFLCRESCGLVELGHSLV